MKNGLSSYGSTMTDTNSIDDIIDTMNRGMNFGESGDEEAREVTTMGSDRIDEILSVMRSVVMTMGSVDRRLTAIETTVSGMSRGMNVSATRTTATIPDPNALRISNTPTFRSGTTNEYTTETGPWSRDETSGSGPAGGGSPASPTRSPFTNVLSTRALSLCDTVATSKVSSKSRSATASRGYDTKQVVWGTCLASLLVSCMRSYITKTGETTHVIDEGVLMSSYKEVVGELYRKAKFADLPPVQSPSVKFLTSTFHRSDNKTCPLSYADTWLSISTHQDGAEAMAVIESIVRTAKKVPEAMIHPISQLVENIGVPVVRNLPIGPTYAIPRSTKITMTPGPYESCCKIFKTSALKVYVSYRLSGLSEGETLTTMLKTMKVSEMFGQGNANRGSEIIANIFSSPASDDLEHVADAPPDLADGGAHDPE